MAIFTSLLGKRHASPRRGARMRTWFQRILWSGLFLLFFLIVWIQLSDFIDDADDNGVLLLMLVGASLFALLGWIGAPLIPRLLGYRPKFKRNSRIRGRG